MEVKSSKELNQKISEYNKEENKFDKLKKGKSRIYFNSVTGELMDSDDGNEADMYEIVPDMEQYSQDNITQYTDICENDKHFFKLWNSFIKSKENKFLKFEEKMINFLNINSKYLCENDLKKNFVQHLVAVHDNRQIDDSSLPYIIDTMHRLFKQYKK